MIHILTVHWKDPSWIRIQLDYLNRNLNEEFKSYAFLNHIDPQHYCNFDYEYYDPIANHSLKLNILGNYAAFNADSDDDIIVFIDGDAFPIRELSEYIKTSLQKHPLVAVQRLENNGDIQPHPCFAFTTVGFWREICGDWQEGAEWLNSDGKLVTDVGGNLMKILDENKVNWGKMIRSNKINEHPLWFGIYDSVIYHHGAGFRLPISRNDSKLVRKLFSTLLPSSIQTKVKSISWLKKILTSSPSVINAKKKANAAFNEIQNNIEFYSKYE